MLQGKEKEKLIDKFRTHEKDTGSPEVQIALLSKQIIELTEHLKKNRKDHHSRRGLLQMVSKGEALLGYSRSEDRGRWEKLTKQLGLK